MPIEAFLFALLLVIALIIARMKDLFGAAMLTGIFSLLSAGMFTLMDAVDVAFTEAAVGAGISTVLLLATLTLTNREERQQPFRWRPVVAVLLTGSALIYGTFDMPHYGDPGAYIHHHLAPDYILGATVDFGLPNIVTAILASYRGFDTLGETAVVFTAGVAVLLLLRRPTRSEEDSA